MVQHVKLASQLYWTGARVDCAGMETMGERIKRLREAKALSQSQLGEMVGVGKSAVSQWESGSTQNIKLNYFLKLLEVLGTDAQYLLWGPDRAPEKSVTAASPSSRGRPAR